MTRVGLILGTGLSDLPFSTDPVTVETPWGDVELGFARDGGVELVALARHGAPHRPAHVVAHKANVHALAAAKCARVVALNTVGALTPTLATGALVVPDDYVDLRAKKESFFDDAPVHVDVSEAYCPTVRATLVDAARRDGARVRDGGVYVATEGPRLETRAEIRMMRALGGLVVGMTGCPEAALARERGLCYASLCLVTNPAAGVAGHRPNAADIRAGARAMAQDALRVALAAARALPAARDCACERALDAARL